MSKIKSLLFNFLKTLLLEPLEEEILEVNKRVIDIQQIILECKTCAEGGLSRTEKRLERIETELRDLLGRK